jgi:hypothetical protein
MRRLRVVVWSVSRGRLKPLCEPFQQRWHTLHPATFEATPGGLMDLEVFSCLDLRPPQLLAPLLHAFAQGSSREACRSLGGRGFMAFKAAVCGPDNLGRLDQDGRLQLVLGPATVPCEGFVPAVILPGSNKRILE